MKKKIVRTALIQQAGNLDKNTCLEHTLRSIEEAAEQGAELILLQELHAGLYFCLSENKDFFQFAESIPGPTTNLLSAAAKKLNVVIVSSIFEKRAVGLYHNTAVVFEKDGTIAGKYRKMHIPDEPRYSEKYYFTPGDMGFNPIQTSVARLGVLVCWDQWYPEGARVMALKGAEILLYPTAIGWYPTDTETTKNDLVDAWVTVQRGHSIANCLPVLACNRIGFEEDPSGATDGMLFWGNSFITNSHGKILKQASRTQPEILIADIDLHETETTRHTWPYLRDRRVDAYEDLVKMYVD